MEANMLDVLNTLSLGLIPAFLVLDLVWRHKRYKTTQFWRVKGFLVSALAFYVSTRTALFWADTLGDFHLLNGAGLGIWRGAAVGIVVYEFFHYWYHRAAHRFSWLWRAGHQMHHAPESLDAYGAYYSHPVDSVLFTTIASLVFFPLLGLVAEAGALGAVFLTFNAMFQHANIKTPSWLGYLIQRPESHSLHHARGVHRHNYADLPVWDMVFGTFKNPERFEEEEGFYPGASDRVVELLLFQDVSNPVAPTQKGPVLFGRREAA